jgi:hypothetical protein
MAESVPEFAPERLDVADTAAIRASLDEHGYACIKEVASEAELAEARDLLWNHLEGKEEEPLMRQPRPVGWKRGCPETWIEGHGDGLLTSGTHCSAMWYVRSLPGVVRAFEAAYGEPAVAAYDRMSVNLPTSSGNPAPLRIAATTFKHGKLAANSLHTHFNQDGYGDEQLICYAIFNFWDMNKSGGATAIVPGSHKRDKVEAINAMRNAQYSGEGRDRKWVGPGKPEEFLEPFTAQGLQPVVLNNKAGDLVLFDTGMYHAGCHAEDPTGMSNGGPAELLRVICILSMAPARLLQPYPEVHLARRRAYELDVFTGGSCMGNLDEHGRPRRAIGFLQKVEQEGEPNVRNFQDAPLPVQAIIDPWSGGGGGARL